MFALRGTLGGELRSSRQARAAPGKNAGRCNEQYGHLLEHPDGCRAH